MLKAIWRWWWKPPLFEPLFLGWLVVMGTISWRIWGLILTASVLDSIWKAVRLLREERIT